MSAEFAGEIVVASKIIDYLSSGLYESPAACLKELVNNSFDADARCVKIFVKPDADRIIIDDDGHGMSQEEFIKNFSKISESHKRETTDVTDSGRPKVGKIGIGFIAANEICDVMELHSTREGSAELIKVTIDFAKMRAPDTERKRKEDQFAKADFVGVVETAPVGDHYTRIYLKRVRGEARQILAGARRPGAASDRPSLYGLKTKSVRDSLAEMPKSWTDFDFYSTTMLQVALNIPIKYHDDWIPRPLAKKLVEFEKRINGLKFEVQYDGVELRKPIVFAPSDKSLVRSFELKGKNVAAKGYFFAQHGTVHPQELQGLLLRIRNAAVGGYDSTFMGFPASHGPLFQKWISAELWADDRLEDAMNIDRKTLRVSHPAYCELQELFHVQLTKFLVEVRDGIYETGAEKRRDQRAEVEVEKIEKAASAKVGASGARASSKIRGMWKRALKTEKERKRLAGKLRVSEFYNLVLDVAYKVLDRKNANRFIEELTKRLTEVDPQ